MTEPGPRPAVPYGDFQLDIYLAGLSGTVPSLPMSFAELESRAAHALPPSVLSYVAGYALAILVAFGWLSAPTPQRVAYVESTLQQELATQQHITATVSCPAVTSFAPESTFNCTVTTQQGASLLFRVTMKDWSGGFTAQPVVSSTS